MALIKKHRRSGSAGLLRRLLACLLMACFFGLFGECRASGGNGAAILTQPAGNYVTGQFLQEISANSTPITIYGETIYSPASSSNIVPQRLVNSSVTSDTNFFTLIRQSVPGADPNASSDNTATPAANGLAINANPWNLPW